MSEILSQRTVNPIALRMAKTSVLAVLSATGLNQH